MEDYKKITIESYNKYAEYFSEKFRHAFVRKEKEEFIKFMNLLDGRRILDIGCGDGEHGVYSIKNGFEVIGIDISDSFLNLAMNKGLNAIKMDLRILNLHTIILMGYGL